jgi:carbon starvation protein
VSTTKGGDVNRLVSILIWSAVAIIGGFAFAAIALKRGESVSAVWLVTAALAVYFLAYRYYSMYIAARVLGVDPRRATPAVRHNDGMDYVPQKSGCSTATASRPSPAPGALVGPVLARRRWATSRHAVASGRCRARQRRQDMIVLFVSVRRRAVLGEMVKMELGNVPGTLALVGVLAIMIIILAVLSLVVVKALAESPWGTFTIAATIPIALAMGVYMRFIRPGRVGEASAFGVVLLLGSIWLGRAVAEHASWGPAFTLGGTEIAWAIIIYGAVASSLPVWLMLAPRDYLSTFLKIGTIVALAIGIYVVAPRLNRPDVTRFIDGSGPVFAGSLFPFLFIAIACGAFSGFRSSRRARRRR